MKKLLQTIQSWILRKWIKRQYEKENGSFELSNNEMSIEQKKQFISKFNEKRMNTAMEPEHKEILSVTVRSKKPNFYDATKNKTFTCSTGTFNLTEKQFFFMNKIKELDSVEGTNAHDVCKAFIENKYGKIDSSIPERHLKHDHHRSTFNYLLKIGLISKTKKNIYKVNF
jgi:hypothetical protein